MPVGIYLFIRYLFELLERNAYEHLKSVHRYRIESMHDRRPYAELHEPRCLDRSILLYYKHVQRVHRQVPDDGHHMQSDTTLQQCLQVLLCDKYSWCSSMWYG